MNSTLKKDILDLSRQTEPLSTWFNIQLNKLINHGGIPSGDNLNYINDSIVSKLRDYRIKNKLSSVVLGMSGGVDSALTAALFKKADWDVIGVTMPIYQNEEETRRGKTTTDQLGLNHVHIDLSIIYDRLVLAESDIDLSLTQNDRKSVIRRGNIKARLRMITLYNLASSYSGIVASTDNFSELAVGFWTICGDVGDVSPIQALTKSWEVPALSRLNNVPEEVWRAKPTDGLGIDNGDEDQFGFSYLELDIMLLSLMYYGIDDTVKTFDDRARFVFTKLKERMNSTWFKRTGPIKFKHPSYGRRYELLNDLDSKL